MKRWLAMLLVATVLAGCDDPAKNVPGRWVDALTPFGLVPIYPPQEDVVPGDVFLLKPDLSKASKAADFWPVRIGQIEMPVLMALMRKEQARRPVVAALSVPAKPAGPARKPAPAAAAKTAAADDGGGEPKVYVLREPNPPKGAVPVVLRQLSLPELQIAHVTAADLAGGGGVLSWLALSGGLGINSQSTVDILLDQLYELHVSATEAIQAARDNVATFLDHYLHPSIMVDLLGQRDPAMARALCRADWPTLDRDSRVVLVANDVVYAGQIKYTFDDSLLAAGVLSAQIGTSPAAAPDGGSGSIAPPGMTPTAQLASLLTTLNERAAKYSADNAGVQTSFGIGRTGHLELIKSYDPPQAVGFAGSALYPIHDLVDVYRVANSNLANVMSDPGLSNLRRVIFNERERALLGARCQEFGVRDGATGLLTYLHVLLPTRPEIQGEPGSRPAFTAGGGASVVREAVPNLFRTTPRRPLSLGIH